MQKISASLSQLPKLQIAATLRLVLILLPLAGMAFVSESREFWIIALIASGFVGLADQGLHPKNLPRLIVPFVLVIWFAFATAFLSVSSVSIFIGMTIWSLLQAAAFIKPVFKGIEFTMGMTLYFVLVATGVLAAVDLFTLMLAVVLGTGWALVIVVSSAVLLANRRTILPLPSAKETVAAIKEEYSLSSHYFVFGLIRGLVFSTFLSFYVLTQSQNAFWIAVTLLAVMMPLEHLYWKKIGERVLGTIIGVGVALLLSPFIATQLALGILVLCVLLLLRASLAWPYAFQATLITLLVIGMYAFSVDDMSPLILMRLLDTLMGAVLAVALSYLILFTEKLLAKHLTPR